MDIDALASFLMELDKLKLVERRSYIAGGVRRENSGEHSWHAALGTWLIHACAQEQGVSLNLTKLLKMALIHDICEIHAGDTPVYQENQDDKFDNEYASLKKVCDLLPESLSDLRDEIESLWLEYEELSTPEARWMKVSDRVIPFIHNMAGEGKTWREQGVKRSQVLGVQKTTKEVCPQIYSWIEERVDEAIGKGWILEE